MVKVVIAGGSGSRSALNSWLIRWLNIVDVGREVFDEILSRRKHEVTLLGRGERPKTLPDEVKWIQVNYDDKAELANALRGHDTLLSFLASPDMDLLVRIQKTLIDVAIEAGVKRFAPSEWATRSGSKVAHYAYKDEIRKYLEEINKPQKVIEYCLFQPGFFTNYFGHPFTTTKHFHMSPMWMDFENCRAIVVGDGDFPLTLTTVQDMSWTVAEALDLESEWPHVGGMRGTQTTVADFIALGEKIRGKSFNVEPLSLEEVKSSTWETSWVPIIDHPGVPVALREQVSRLVLREYTLSLAAGAWSVDEVWNGIFTSHRYLSAEDYLRKIWAGK